MTATAQKEPSIAEILHAMDEDDKKKEATMQAKPKEEAKEPISNDLIEVSTDDKLTIIPDLRDLLDTLREESSEELEKSILAEGVRDPIVVWKEKNALLDGHNRFRIAKKHKLTLKKVERSFADIEQAKEWMIQNQLGRRNLTPDRFEYLLGTLYNTKKQSSTSAVGGKRTAIAGPKTAEQIAAQFGVSERTVRRAGETAVGIDKLEQIRGKVAKNNQLSGKGDYTRSELTELGKTPNLAVGKKMMENLDAIKNKVKQEKAAVKQEQKAVAAAPETYSVVFVQPDFGSFGFNVANQVRPPLDQKNAIVYMFVPDPYMGVAMDLLNKWGLTYEGSFVFYGSAPTDEGVFSKIVHNFMVMATKGTVVGPKAGHEMASVQKVNGDMSVPMIKIIDAYHPKTKKLDFRKGRTAPGWDAYRLNK